MNETPEERARRLADMQAYQEMTTALKRAEARALREQSEEVQQIASLRDAANQWSDALGINFEYAFPEGDGRPEGALPATVEAGNVATDALRRFAAQLSVEIGTRWQH
jgi:hypothetical protein